MAGEGNDDLIAQQVDAFTDGIALGSELARSFAAWLTDNVEPVVVELAERAAIPPAMAVSTIAEHLHKLVDAYVAGVNRAASPRVD